jgi:hypothetical protein
MEWGGGGGIEVGCFIERKINNNIRKLKIPGRVLSIASSRFYALSE